MSPWVTGGAAADVLVLAATLVEDGAATDRQLLVAVPRDRPGLTVAEPLPLVGVSASSTGPVHLDGVEVSNEWVIAGPMRHDVMASGIGAGTGGHETSTLAIGLAEAAIDYLADESIAAGRFAATDGRSAISAHSSWSMICLRCPRRIRACSKESIRQRANSLVLRGPAGGAWRRPRAAGYVVGHPAGRWCREALFFLVWSCPQPVATANLCELAGIGIGRRAVRCRVSDRSETLTPDT